MTTIVTKNGSGAPLASDLVQGELAVDLTNKRLYTEDSGGTVIEVGTSPSTIDINAGTIDGTVIGGTTAAAGTFTTFTSTGIDDNATSTAITIDSSQNVGIGTASPSLPLEVDGVMESNAATNGVRVRRGSTGYYGEMSVDYVSSKVETYIDSVAGASFSGEHVFRSSSGGGAVAERMRIDSSGNVGIGTSSPSAKLDFGESLANLLDPDEPSLRLYQSQSNASIKYGFNVSSSQLNYITPLSGDSHVFHNIQNGELMRIDSSGRVGIGETSPDTRLHVTGTTSDYGILAEQPSGYAGLSLKSTTVNQTWSFIAQDNGSNSDLLLYGGSSAGTKMTIDSSGNLLVGQTAVSRADNGIALRPGGTDDAHIIVTNERSSGGALIEVNRQVSDGTLIAFYQADSVEGTISVSGTTVSYNGGHLSRWSQSDTDDVSSLYKGTVMSNLDEMCEWDNEDNEQLNKTKVSDVEGDVNVAGVFVAEDNSDDLSDYYLAMTGDMIIRIAQGTTVQRGDLLMSAGDGTAKPQDDDIVRSKTIAKVTSTNVTCTYADGSYCVPCVLMAC